MPLDRRLRDEFERTAAGVIDTVNPHVMIAVIDRASHIRRNRRVAATGAALAVLIVMALASVPRLHLAAETVPPGSSPRPSPIRSSLDQTFTSKTHGYAMALPADWTAAPARDASQPDRFRSPRGATVTVTSEQLAPNQTVDEWVTDYLPVAGGGRPRVCFPPRDQWIPVDVGGRPGGLLGGDFGCELTEAVVFVGSHVYVVDAVPELPTGLFDQGLLDQMLASIVFMQGVGTGPSSQ